LEQALSEEARPGAERKLTGKEEALLVATACAKPPAGAPAGRWSCWPARWSSSTDHESLSHETVRRRLAENHLKPWRREMWCVPRVDGEYVARMETCSTSMPKRPIPKRPVRPVFDESSDPAHWRGAPADPGRSRASSNDTTTSTAATAPSISSFPRHQSALAQGQVTARRTAKDYAQCMRELVDVHYPDADTIGSCRITCRATLLAPSTRLFRRPKPGASCGGLIPLHAQARQLLNMVEIEIGVLRANALTAELMIRNKLKREIAAWERQRNAAALASIDVHNRQGTSQNGPRLPRPGQRVIITVQSYKSTSSQRI